MPYRPTEKTEARKKAQHALLLSSALKLVAEHGFQKLTMLCVSQKADVAIGTVYKYFDSKAELCADVFRMGGEVELKYVQDTAFPEGVMPGDISCKQRLLSVVTAVAERALANYQFAYAMMAEPIDPEVEAERLNYRREFANILKELIDEGIEQGEFCVQNSKVTSTALVGLLAETLLGPIGVNKTEPLPCDQQTLVHNIQSFCLRAVSV